MAGSDAGQVRRQVALGHVQVRTADAAGAYADEDLPLTRLGNLT
jgi:hypothetical protein